jgi:hypothetical protein
MKRKILVAVVLLCLLAAVAYVGGRFYTGYVIREEIDMTVERSPTLADVAYRRIDFSLLHPRIRIEDLTILLADPPGRIEVEEVVVYRYIIERDLPVDVHFQANGIKLDTDRFPLARVRPVLETMGYRTIKAALQCEYTFHKKNQALDIKQLNISAEQIGHLRIKTILKNINPGKIISNSHDELYLLTQLPAVAISKAELSYDDDSLAQRIYRLSADQKGRPVSYFVQKIVRRLEDEISLEEKASTRKTIAALNRFLRNPEKISTTIEPDHPVSLGRLFWVKKPGELIELLNVEVEI